MPTAMRQNKSEILYLARDDAIPVYAPELPLRSGAIVPEPPLEIANALRDASPDAWGRRVIAHRLAGGHGAASEIVELDELTRTVIEIHKPTWRVGGLASHMDRKGRDRPPGSPTHQRDHEVGGRARAYTVRRGAWLPADLTARPTVRPGAYHQRSFTTLPNQYGRNPYRIPETAPMHSTPKGWGAGVPRHNVEITKNEFLIFL